MLTYSKIAALLLTGMLLTSCGNEHVTGSGAPKSDNRTISAFTSLNISGSYKIDGSCNNTPMLTITSNENLLPYIASSVSRGTLTIQNKKNVALYPTTQQTIKFATESLESLTMNGNSSLSFDNLKTKSLSMNLSGSNNVSISGEAKTLDIIVNGAGEVDTRHFKVNNGHVEINGNATVYINATKSLDVTINGNGKIISLGGSTKIKQSINGSGQIISDFGGGKN